MISRQFANNKKPPVGLAFVEQKPAANLHRHKN